MPRDPAASLVRALLADAAAAGCRAQAVAVETSDWSSATFTGARHRILLSAPADDPIDRWLRHLRGAALRLPRQLLGDLSATRAGRNGAQQRIAVSALTLDDG